MRIRRGKGAGPRVWSRPGSRQRRARNGRLRRLVAAGCVAVAAVVALGAVRAPSAASRGEATVVALRTIPAGAIVGADDVVLEQRPSAQRPESAVGDLRAVIGRVAASPIAAREVMTPGRIVGPGLLEGQPPGQVALTVPVLDVDGTGAGPGDRIDLFATGTGERVASAAVVLALHGGGNGGVGGGLAGGLGGGTGGSAATGGPSLTLSVDPATATTIATSLRALSAGESFVVALRRD